MKHLIWLTLCIFSMSAFSQNLQLHYELRHTADPKHNPQNFPALYFEYFKLQTDTSLFIRPGSFLFTLESDLQGDKNNTGKAFMQVAQTFRFWKPHIFIGVQYSGGLGVTEPKQYSYYINNTLAIGPSVPFQINGMFFNAFLYYTHSIAKKPGNDAMLSLYFWKGLFHYRAEFAGDFEFYSANKNNGNDPANKLTGKRLCLFGQPNIWYNINKTFAIGSKQLMYYHVNTPENVFQIYSTVAVKVKF